MNRPWTMSDADRRLIPSSGLTGPVPLLFAIMLFIMVVAAGTGLMINNLSARVGSSIEHRYTIQINDGSARAPAALAALRQVPEVARAEMVPEAALRQTLARWLGPASDDPALPIPTMIDVDLKPGANPQTLQGFVARVIPGATLQAHAETLRPMLRSLQWLGWLALALVVLIAAATCAAVVMAARAALDSHRSTIEVMHGIGATDGQISRIFLRQIAGEALLGGLVGTVAAILVGVGLSLGNGLSSLMAGSPALGWGDLLIIAILPVIATAIATLVARRALMNALGDRL